MDDYYSDDYEELDENVPISLNEEDFEEELAEFTYPDSDEDDSLDL